MLFIPDLILYPSRISDPGVKKAPDLGSATLVEHPCSTQCGGSGYALILVLWSRIMKGKITLTKVKNFHVLNCWSFHLMAGCFSGSLNFLYITVFIYFKNMKFGSNCKSFTILGHKTLDPGPHWKKNAGSNSSE